MPYDRNHKYYASPILLPLAQVARTYKTATATLSAWDVEGAKEILATLKVHEFLATALAGANNDLVFIAKTPGTTPSITVAYIDPSDNDQALGVVVTDQAIVVNLATGPAGAITSTASQVKAAIEASAAASALVEVQLAPSNTGAGVVTALTETALAGPVGTNPTLDVILECSIDGGTTYYTAGSFTQATGAGIEGKLVQAVGLKGRWKATIGGSNSPAFVFSIDAVTRS